MKIDWKANPFDTVILLTDEEKKEYRYKIAVYELEDRIGMAHAALSRDYEGGRRTKEEAALEYLGRDDFRESLGRPFDKWLDEQTDEMISYLECPGSHMGDCICWPCSCERCRAEGYLGVDVLAGCYKQWAAKIRGAFRPHGDDLEYKGPVVERTIDEVLAYLKDGRLTVREKTAANPPKGYDWTNHIDRWESEYDHAIEWLTKYKLEHGF